MKIAIFSGDIPSTTFIEHLIEGVAEHHRVLLFGVVERPKSYPSKNIKIYKTPQSHILNLCFTLWRLLLLGFLQPKHILKLFKEVKKYKKLYEQWIWFSKFLPIVLYKPDILHLQWARDLEFYYFLKEKFNIKLVVSLRGAHINYTPIVEPRMAVIYNCTFPMIDGFHAVSLAIGLEAQKYGAMPDKIRCIHSVIPPRFFHFFKPFEKSKNKTIQIVSVGRFHWKKGFQYAFDALYLLKKAGLDVEYTVIGSEVIPENVLFHLHQLHLEPQIKFIGTLAQEDLLETLKSFDALLLSSVEEGIANVVLEAMAVGLPVISTNCGGMAEVVAHKDTGWLVNSRSPKAIANAIIELSETSEKELQRITQNAHNIVKEHFSAKDSLRKFIELYETVIKN